MSVIPTRRSVLRGAAVAAAVPLAGGIATGSAFASPSHAHPHKGADLGPNVLVFDPSMGDAAIQAQCDAVFAIQESNQFGDERYALAFMPGTYNVDINVGFYTHVLGLGDSPDDVLINGHVTVDAQWFDGNGTQDFWRAAENLSIAPPDGLERWAVAQAGPMRRVHVKGDMILMPSPPGNGWSSGGFLADSVVDGQVNSGSQQQWLSRNDTFGSWTGANWNMVFVGVQGAPAQSFPTPPMTTVDRTPVVREKPYLTVDRHGDYQVFVPALHRSSTGTTWAHGRTAGHGIALSRFFVAKPGDSVADINRALSRGQHLLFTPGIYNLSSTIRVTRPGTVVLGLGYTTLRSTHGNTLIEVADVSGVTVAGVLVEAASKHTPVLLKVGEGRSRRRHTEDPTVLYDVFARIGGAVAGGAGISLQIDSNDVICDHLWLWRADHGLDGTVGWTVNPADTGIVVNGDHVTAYGLFVEHYQKYEVIWNGEHGRTYFFQNENPYDVPTQSAWVNGSTKGYAAYKVGAHVRDHQAWGLGSYCFFNLNADIYTDATYEVPDTPGVVFTDLMTVCLNGAGGGGMLHCINNSGDPVQNGFAVFNMKSYSNGVAVV
ncbi:adenylyl cyclase [Actinacidiphila bryophytorum]|uniref:adenylyl cyclase n=1 Tax=Actinacidiphila bryophytorum TaxID=1436133 RepID=UPI002176EBF2|nr:adenylyl cyclase [Actinacidiphila bryophytorum]UWE10909.1 adenylyl cyclase [Actinacidiphila bryophytorum]